MRRRSWKWLQIGQFSLVLLVCVCVQVEVVKGRVKKLAANIAGYG